MVTHPAAGDSFLTTENTENTEDVIVQPPAAGCVKWDGLIAFYTILYVPAYALWYSYNFH